MLQEVNPVLRKLSVLSRAPHRALASRHSDSSAADKRNRMYLDLADDDYLFDDEEEEETLSEEPPAAALQRRRRRRALVPPKLITDGYESCTEGFDEGASKSRSKFSSSGSAGGGGTLSPSGRSGSVNNIATDNADNDASDLDQITVLGGGSLTPTSKSAVSSKLNLSSMDELGTGQGAGEQPHLTPNVTIEGIEGDTAVSGLGKGPSRKEGIGIRSIPKFGGSPSSPNRARASNSGSSGSGGSSTSNYLGVNHGSRNRRRSSVVVIPPMQICPGDLLVYSKVLSQRSNMIGKCSKIKIYRSTPS